MKTCRRYLWSILVCVPLFAGCNLFPHIGGTTNEKTDKEAVAGLPSKYSFRVSQFVFLSDIELKRDQPLFKELGVLREQVYRDLRLPPSNTEVFVCLFEDRDHFEKFMQNKYPYLPKRRAFFVAQPRRLGGTEDLMVFTYWGDHIQQDLRHELTHALLHSTLKDVPIWLDEGLAEYSDFLKCRPTGTASIRSTSSTQCGEARRPFLPDLDRAWSKLQGSQPDEPGRVPRELGVGPSDAAQHAASQAGAVELLAGAAHQSRSGPLRLA